MCVVLTQAGGRGDILWRQVRVFFVVVFGVCASLLLLLLFEGWVGVLS